MRRMIMMVVVIMLGMFGCCMGDMGVEVWKRGRGIEGMMEATVGIMGERVDGRGEYIKCGGVWVDGKRFLTARHCVEEGGKALGRGVRYHVHGEYIMRENGYGDKVSHFGVVVKEDESNDLALVLGGGGVEYLGHGVVGIGRVGIGDGVRVVGHTGGVGYVYMEGLVSRERYGIEYEGDRYWQVSGFMWEGNSGGGMFDWNGRLVGICSSVWRRGPGTVFFVHRDVIVEFLRGELERL